MPSNSYLYVAKKAVMPGKWERFVILTDVDHVQAWKNIKAQYPTQTEDAYDIAHLGTLPASLPGTTVQCSQSAPLTVVQSGGGGGSDEETF